MNVRCGCGNYVVRARKETTGKIDLFETADKGCFFIAPGANIHEPAARPVRDMPRPGIRRFRIHRCKIEGRDQT
jgi:hypothetical protein